jgi:cyclopropane-fatty-acyl-phospholipid synthase
MQRNDAIELGTRMPDEKKFSIREAVVIRALKRAFRAGSVVGQLQVTFPSGRMERFGQSQAINQDGSSGHDAQLILHSFEPLWQVLTRGSLGVAECYFDGTLDSPNLGAALRFCLVNTQPGSNSGGKVMRPRFWDRRWHKSRANTRAGSRRNIAAHYDLGNAFYQLWLDPSMTYSSALFSDTTTTLECAQQAKNQLIMTSLGVVAGDRVLEIGCGWGGFAEAAASAGAHVTGITLSQQQLAYARARLSNAGLAEQTSIEFTDYRDVGGAFDKIASIEMIEAVGEDHWADYFQTLHQRLTRGGVAVVQAITIDERHFEAYRREPDFIQRYIFPGGMLPTVTAMRDHADRAGLTFETVERFGSSYARTLAIWHLSFQRAWPQIAPLGFDERFRRMWEYYLTYCEVGFENGDVDVGVYRLTRRS